MLIEEIFDEIRLVFRKQRRGSLRDTEIETAVNLACKELFGELVENFYKTGVVPTSLEPFTKKTTLNYASSDAAQLNLVTPEYDILVVAKNALPPVNYDVVYSEQEFFDRASSALIEADEDKFFIKREDYLHCNQAITETVQVIYLIDPEPFFIYAVTVNVDGRGTTFNSGGSTDLLFKKTDIPKIVSKALVTLGLSLQAQDTIQVGAGKDN